MDKSTGSVSINFLRQKDKGFFDKFLAWALSVGRVIIVLTETVALAAFLYRFSLDQQIIDLHGTIKSKQNIVAAFNRSGKYNEKTFRNLHDRINAAKNLSSKSSQSLSLLSDILSLTAGTTVNDLTLSQDSIKIDMSISSVGQLQSLVQNLQKNAHVSSVSIDKIENRTSQGLIRVQITAQLKTIT